MSKEMIKVSNDEQLANAQKSQRFALEDGNKIPLIQYVGGYKPEFTRGHNPTKGCKLCKNCPGKCGWSND